MEERHRRPITPISNTAVARAAPLAGARGAAVGTICWERTASREEEPPIVVLEKPKEERSDQSPTAAGGERSNNAPVVSAQHTAHCDLAQPNCVCSTQKYHCRMATTGELGQHRSLLSTATAPRICVGVRNEEESPENETATHTWVQRT